MQTTISGSRHANFIIPQHQLFMNMPACIHQLRRFATHNCAKLPVRQLPSACEPSNVFDASEAIWQKHQAIPKVLERAQRAHHGQEGCCAATERMAHDLQVKAWVAAHSRQQGLRRLAHDPPSRSQHPEMAVAQHHALLVHHVVRLACARQAGEHVLKCTTSQPSVSNSHSASTHGITSACLAQMLCIALPDTCRALHDSSGASQLPSETFDSLWGDFAECGWMNLS